MPWPAFKQQLGAPGDETLYVQHAFDAAARSDEPTRGGGPQPSTGETSVTALEDDEADTYIYQDNDGHELKEEDNE